MCDNRNNWNNCGRNNNNRGGCSTCSMRNRCVGFQSGFNAGFEAGKINGFNAGFQAGVESANHNNGCDNGYDNRCGRMTNC